MRNHFSPFHGMLVMLAMVPVLVGGCASSGVGGHSKNGAAADGGGSGSLARPALGVIRLDYDYPPILGDVDFPGSFGFPVEYEVIEGLTFEMCQKGELDDTIRKRLQAGIRRLEQRKVAGISGDCGFMMQYQDFVRKQTDLPVFMSSIIFAPVILPMLGPSDKVAILTANSVALNPALPGMLDAIGLKGQEDRFVVVGCQDVPGFEAVAEGRKVDPVKVGPGIEEIARRTLVEHPEVKAFIYECTELGAYGNRVRAATGLPVFDAITLLDFFHLSVRKDERLAGPADTRTGVRVRPAEHTDRR